MQSPGSPGGSSDSSGKSPQPKLSPTKSEWFEERKTQMPSLFDRMKDKVFGHQPVKRPDRTVTKQVFLLRSFDDLFGDEYDHPFNEEIEKVLMEWPADD
jgi:hypothetical protein